MAPRVRPVQRRTDPASTSIMPRAQRSPAAAVVGEDGLGHLAGLGGVALLEARPGEQAMRPAQAALVADLLEGGRGLAQPHLGLLGPPA